MGIHERSDFFLTNIETSHFLNVAFGSKAEVYDTPKTLSSEGNSEVDCSIQFFGTRDRDLAGGALRFLVVTLLAFAPSAAFANGLDNRSGFSNQEFVSQQVGHAPTRRASVSLSSISSVQLAGNTVLDTT